MNIKNLHNLGSYVWTCVNYSDLDQVLTWWKALNQWDYDYYKLV